MEEIPEVTNSSATGSKSQSLSQIQDISVSRIENDVSAFESGNHQILIPAGPSVSMGSDRSKDDSRDRKFIMNLQELQNYQTPEFANQAQNHEKFEFQFPNIDVPEFEENPKKHRAKNDSYHTIK